MRPLKLTMQAFGAYPDYIEIPFENLGSSNIYLICGATGSGKTTIFDAVCYSLFNTSSGTNRGNDTLRSHFAKDNIESFVEFTFLYKGEIYKIRRNPSYYRKKLKGEGLILENAKALLTLPDGKIINGIKEVDSYIENLIGLNAQRFSQIALLAQGDFLKILNSDTQTRGEIFRTLFKTSDYSLFQQKLKIMSDEKKELYEKLNSSILSHINEMEISDDETLDLKNKICEVQSFELLDEFIQKADSLVESDMLKISQIQQEINSLNKSNVQMEKNLDILNEKEALLQSIAQSEKLYQKNLVEFEKIKKDFESLDTLKQQSDNLKKDIQKLDEDYKKSKKIVQLKNEINILEKEKAEIISHIDNNDSNIEKLKYDFICNLSYILNLMNDELKRKQQDLIKKKENYNLKNGLYLEKYNKYLSSQAGILALSLKENCPCPVCGSTVHPDIAKPSDNEITKEELDKMKSDLDCDNSNLSNLALDCSLLSQNYENKLLEFEKNKKLYGTDKHIIPLDDNKNYEDEIKKLSDKIVQYKDELNKKNIEITALNSALNTLKKDINNIDTIQDEYEKLNNELNYLQNKISKIEISYHEEHLGLNKLKAELDLLKNQKEKYSSFDFDKNTLLENVSKNKTLISNLNIELENYLSKKSFNEKKILIIKNEFSGYTQAQQNYLTYKTLSDCAQGILKGKAKIPFEQYIQGYYLDMVLFEANKRLSVMTKNQFRLYRKKEITSKVSKTGLEIEVMDFHTGKKRDTKTLSGGESFMAALAMALGLSDCISSLSGAVDIGAMFIDEGFGSLDSEALELALDTIVSLTCSNRLVGIISHVDELKNKIQNQINTYKSNSGSFIEINF